MQFSCEILPTGGLEIRAEGEASADLIDALADDKPFWVILCDGLEHYSCNGSFTPFDAGAGNPFVGLSDAPCIAESMDYGDNGLCAIEGRFWYFNNYALECPLETLARNGQVVFTLAV